VIQPNGCWDRSMPVRRTYAIHIGNYWKQRLFKSIDHYNSNWKTLQARFKNNQKRSKIAPGIYVQSFVGHSKHYYAVRKEKDGSITIGNGYSATGGFGKYGKGLDAQENHSHGLCQTYALMYYLTDDDLLTEGEYEENALTAIKYLEDFTKKYDFNWSTAGVAKDLKILCFNENHEQERKTLWEKLKGMRGKGARVKNPNKGQEFTLSGLVKFVASKKCSDNFITWFNG